MGERVSAKDLGTVWEPNAPEAILISTDSGAAVLALRAHPDDADQRCVVVVWAGTELASFGGPNDEARSGHRLYI
jgi:hypothetical protein